MEMMMMTMISNILFPFVLSLPIFFFFFVYHSQLNKQKLPLPPGPFPLPIVGNLLKIDPKKPHISLAELAKSYGPLMTLRLGSRLFVVATSPEVAKEVYITHDKVLSGRYVPEVSRRLQESFTSGMAISDPADEKWRELRGTLHSSLFTPHALESSSQLRVDKANQMVEFLRSKSGQVVNITDVTYSAIINTWTGLLVSQDFPSRWEDVGELRDYMEVLISKSHNDDQINNLLTQLQELLVTAETVAIAELIKNQEKLVALCKELDEAAVDDYGATTKLLRERDLDKLPLEKFQPNLI